MNIIPLYGHATLRERLAASERRGALPHCLLLHGPRGVGKQRLALWLGQLLLCTSDDKPCGRCQSCRYAVQLAHPDLRWFFPRPRMKDADPAPAEVLRDYAEAIAERVEAGGLYAPPSGTEGIFVSTVRAVVQHAAMTPAFAARKIFVVGDADRLVSQEGADQAANAFLKLLEEPLDDTVIILTSSEPGALLPTIRSRVVALRVAPLGEDDVRAFLADERVRARLGDSVRSTDVDGAVASGAPGELFAGSARAAAAAAATRMLEVALASAADRGGAARLALGQGGSKARGAFTDVLDELTVLLHARAREAAARADDRAAVGAARATTLVENAKRLATGNVSPQLVTAVLLRDLAAALR